MASKSRFRLPAEEEQSGRAPRNDGIYHITWDNISNYKKIEGKKG